MGDLEQLCAWSDIKSGKTRKIRNHSNCWLIVKSIKTYRNELMTHQTKLDPNLIGYSLFLMWIFGGFAFWKERVHNRFGESITSYFLKASVLGDTLALYFKS